MQRKAVGRKENERLVITNSPLPFTKTKFGKIQKEGTAHHVFVGEKVGTKVKGLHYRDIARNTSEKQIQVGDECYEIASSVLLVLLKPRVFVKILHPRKEENAKEGNPNLLMENTT